jgi:hypothetical protein
LSPPGPAFVSGTAPDLELNITGSGPVSVTATQPGNYDYYSAPPVTQSITVDQAPMTVAAPQGASKEIGQPNPTFAATYSGFVNGDTQASALTGQPSFTTTATTSSTYGEYPVVITQGTLASTNYAFTFVNGTLTVTGTASQTITFAQPPGDNLRPIPDSGIKRNIEFRVARRIHRRQRTSSVSGSTLTITGAGSIVIVAAQPGNNTYAGATPVTQTLTVVAAPLTVTGPSVTVSFGATINPAAFPAPTITGFVGSDTASLVTGVAQYATSATSASNPGSYPITVALGTLAIVPQAATNYALANFVPGTLTITPITQTISNSVPPPMSFGLLFSITALG